MHILISVPQIKNKQTKQTNTKRRKEKSQQGAGEEGQRQEHGSADTEMRSSVFLGVMSQPRNPQAEQWSCLSSNRGLAGDRGASILEERARGVTPALCCTAPLSVPFRSPLLVSLNNSQDLLFPPNPSLHPTSSTLPGLPFFRGKVT